MAAFEAGQPEGLSWMAAMLRLVVSSDSTTPSKSSIMKNSVVAS
jgi:hypothetical protein